MKHGDFSMVANRLAVYNYTMIVQHSISSLFHRLIAPEVNIGSGLVDRDESVKSSDVHDVEVARRCKM